MDLAKIRKKYLQVPAEDSTAGLKPEPATAALPAAQSSDPVIGAPVILESDLFLNIIPEKAEQLKSAETYYEKTAANREPIEIILAGRRAAGCNEELQEDTDISTTVLDNRLEYLCFRVSDEIYGINIMDIKEIIKPREVTEIPRAPEFVSGVISLRGTIIPIIDMRYRLGLSRDEVTGKERVVVIKNGQSFSGLLVDEVIQVVRVNKENIEPAPSVLEGIDRDFVSGIGRSEGRFIIILNLESIADIHLY